MNHEIKTTFCKKCGEQLIYSAENQIGKLFAGRYPERLLWSIGFKLL